MAIRQLDLTLLQQLGQGGAAAAQLRNRNILSEGPNPLNRRDDLFNQLRRGQNLLQGPRGIRGQQQRTRTQGTLDNLRRTQERLQEPSRQNRLAARLTAPPVPRGQEGGPLAQLRERIAPQNIRQGVVALFQNSLTQLSAGGLPGRLVNAVA